MSHTSPASYLVWSLLTCLVAAFLIFHLWSFDKFRCLRWNNGPSSGAFKRIMTYSYILTIPLIAAYSVGFAVIKYQEGFIILPVYGVIPKPYQLWKPATRHAIFPLMLTFSIGWSLEMVTHLEELCFWLFLVNSGSRRQDWFHSLYFKAWVLGSSIAVIYMPLITIFTRGDPLRSEAYTFLAGSLGSLSLTLWFTPVLWAFPAFLRNLRSEGVDTNTVVRLTKFSELNTIRVVFRFLFTIPFLILGVDGVRPHHHINESMLWTDFLSMIAGVGCAISSAITLVIFFPRSVEGEIAARDASRERKRNRTLGGTSLVGSHFRTYTNMTHSVNEHYNGPPGMSGSYLLTSSPVKQSYPLEPESPYKQASDFQGGAGYWSSSMDKQWNDEEGDIPSALPVLPPIRPNRRKGRDVELGGIDVNLTEENLSRHNLKITSGLNPMIHNFTSPIDLGNGNGKESWLTFSRH